jgi:leader peptidase (prepilin peptidase)/N-methyltransferase
VPANLAFPPGISVLGTDHAGGVALVVSLCTVLVIVTLTDLERRVIPNGVLLAGVVAAVGIATATDSSSLGERIIAAAASGGFMFCVALASPRGMGMGDVKLVAMMGLYLGRSVAPALLVSFTAGAAVGVVMIAREGASARKRSVPFGPFLALGGFAALSCGDAVVDWYLGAFIRG